MAKVLVATVKPFAPAAVEQIKEIADKAGYEVQLLEKYADQSDFVNAVIDVDALIVRSDKVTREVIESGKKLKVVLRAGAGDDNLDLEAATKKGVVAMNTPGQNSNAVAELAIGMMIFNARNGFNGKAGKELKGKGGVQEILEQTLGEQKALEIMEELQRILGASPHTSDTIFSLVDVSRQLYYVAIPRKGWIARVQRRINKDGVPELVYKEIIAECCPTKVVVYEDPLGGLRKFEIEFTGMLNKTLGPAELDVIVNRLKADAVVKHQRLIYDAYLEFVSSFLEHTFQE